MSSCVYVLKMWKVNIHMARQRSLLETPFFTMNKTLRKILFIFPLKVSFIDSTSYELNFQVSVFRLGYYHYRACLEKLQVHFVANKINVARGWMNCQKWALEIHERAGRHTCNDDGMALLHHSNLKYQASKM